MRRLSRKHVVIALGVLVGLLALAGLMRKRRLQLARLQPAKSYAAVVQAARVTRGELKVGVRYLGEIVPVTENSLASKVSGFIERIEASEGDVVKAGKILVKIDDREIRDRLREVGARIREARSNLLAQKARIPGLEAAAATARNIFERNQTLYRSKAIAREELEISEKDYQMTLSELESTRESIKAVKSSIASLEAERGREEVLLSYSTIKAPFKGIVSKKVLSVGDLAVPGKAILKLVRPKDGVKIEMRLDLKDFARVRIGTPATIFFAGHSLTAPVSALYPSTGSESLGIVNIVLPRSPFHLPFHGRVEVRLVLARARGMLAPISCLLRHGSKSLAIKIDSSKRAQLVPLEVCGENESHFCFRSSQIQVGDLLASGRESRLMRIFSGQQVEIVP